MSSQADLPQADSTYAKNDTDKATVAFVVANAAVASDKDALVFLSIEAVRLRSPVTPTTSTKKASRR
jgi:predicted peroxiredoxin